VIDGTRETKTTPVQHPPQVLMAGGKVASTKGPAYHLIPTAALNKLAERFELGIERKGDKAWNATSNNQDCLTDKDLLIERCSHIIHHALKLRDQLQDSSRGEESIQDNAAAVMWGGAFLVCAGNALANCSGAVTLPPKSQSIVTYNSVQQLSAILPKLTLRTGVSYMCRNKADTGYLCEMNGEGKPTSFFSKKVHVVTWNPDGKAKKIDQGMSHEEESSWDILLG